MSVTLPDLALFQFSKLYAEVGDEDVERAIEMMRRQLASWFGVDRPAETGDSVIINYYAKVGDRVFDGKDFRVELVADEGDVGFEQSLVGVSVGDRLSVELTFPEAHYQPEVAGRTVTFDVEVTGVKALVLPELDAKFIRSHSIKDGTLDSFRRAVRGNMNTHLQKIIRMKNTLNVLGGILEKYPVEAPQLLIEQEVTRLTCDPCEEVEGVESFKHDMNPEMFTDLARTRVQRSLMVHELAREHDIELDEEEVRNRLEDLVEEYTDNDRIIEWFYEDRIRLASIESDVLADQVVDWILETFGSDVVRTSYGEMMDLKIGHID